MDAALSCESHTHGASKRQADEDAHCAFHRADCGTASHPEGCLRARWYFSPRSRAFGLGSCWASSGKTSIFRRWRSMSSARSSCNMWVTVRPKPLANRFRSICDCQRSCGTGDYRVNTPCCSAMLEPELLRTGDVVILESRASL